MNKEPFRKDIHDFKTFQNKVLKYFSDNKKARNDYLLKLDGTLCFLRQCFMPDDEPEKERLAVIHLAGECEDLTKENKCLKEFNTTLSEKINNKIGELEKKDKIIKEAIEFTKEHIFQVGGDKDFKHLLKILERADTDG